MWKHLEVTVEEGIFALAGLHSFLRGDSPSCQYIPKPDAMTKKLLNALNIDLPEVLPYTIVDVATRKKLVNERKAFEN